MKTISIKQPWASLIAHGIKDIENRTWKYPSKYIGQRVLIHASKKSTDFWDSSPEISEIVDKFLSEISKSGTDWSPYPFGAIIGSVVIADCVQNHTSVWAEKECWNWALEYAALFDELIEGLKRILVTILFHNTIIQEIYFDLFILVPIFVKKSYHEK